MTRKVVLALTLAVAMSGAFAQSAAAQQTSAQAFKDIKVLRDLPADQLLTTMQFFEGALGVGCNFCHLPDRVRNTEIKDTSRKMVELVRAINRDHFGGETEVTCYTCHRGQTNPPENPALATAEFRPWEPDLPNGAANAAPVPGPAATQIIDKWIAATGGMDKINGITSLALKGTVTNSVGVTQPYERIMKGDNSLLIVGNANIGRTGSTGWFRAGNGNPRDIRNYEMNQNRFRNAFWLAKNVKSFSQLESRLDEIRDGVPVYQVRGVSRDGVPVRMWFSRETGNLLRVLWFNQTAVGQNMERVDYFDFAEADGFRSARRAVVRTPLAYQTVRVESIQLNIPVEDSRFQRPTTK